MFDQIPSADALFFKCILHEHCVKLLKKSYEAIAEHGKLLIVDMVIDKKEVMGMREIGLMYDGLYHWWKRENRR
ncbi:hypothetical protein SUGI_0623990 [Cryptomeria japonica]|nr:hypothetical protein SUGI_0623990 [Cryptomeria japonica]